MSTQDAHNEAQRRWGSSGFAYKSNATRGLHVVGYRVRAPQSSEIGWSGTSWEDAFTRADAEANVQAA